jgi:hypothetical protein
MELRKEELSEEQLQLMTEFHSKNQLLCTFLGPIYSYSWARALALVEVRCVPQLVVRGAVEEII